MKNIGVNPGYSITKISNRREGEAGTNVQGKNWKIGNMFNTWKKSEPQIEHRTQIITLLPICTVILISVLTLEEFQI